ncbi:TonB-dependent receptor domain-containing protein [Thermaurantiacus sp.]
MQGIYRATCALGALAVAIMGGTSAAAQSTAAATTADQGEIIVTGTLIRGSVATGALPVTVVTDTDILRQGAPSILELTKRLPAVAGTLGDTNQFDSRSQGAEGVTSINLRGLGPQRTLVLMNGKRFAESPIGTPAVDTSLIPGAAIGRIEVLAQGASTTYGSDAIAGVVNFITNSGFEGFRLVGDYRAIKGSNGDWSASALWGHQTERLRLLASFGYQHRSPLSTLDRDYAFRPYPENPAGGWSQGGNPSAFIPFRIGGAGTGATAGLMLDRGCGTLGGFELVQSRNPSTNQPLLGRCATNFTSYDLLVDKEDRFQFYFEGELDVAERVKMRASILYGRTDVLVNTSPTYLFLNTPSAQANPIGSQFFVPENNPGLAAYRAANPDQFPGGATNALLAAGTFRVSMVAGSYIHGDVNGIPGATPIVREGNSFRVTGGLSFDLSEALNIDIDVMHHAYERYNFQWDTAVDRLQLALRGLGGPDCKTNTPGENGCLWFNPFSNGVQSNVLTGEVNPNFNPSLANSRDVVGWFTLPLTWTLRNELMVVDAVASGKTPLELKGGNLSYATGFQYRKYHSDFTYNLYNNLDAFPCAGSLDFGVTNCAQKNGLFGFLAALRSNTADLDVWAMFGEVQVPLFEGFDLSAAVRYEDYGGSIGSTVDPKVTARWQALPAIALRGSVSTTFRGPPATAVQPGDSVTSLQFIGGAFRGVDVFDNPNLTPESAFSWSTGVVVDKNGFILTADYWSYKFQDQIIAEGVQGLVNTVFGVGATAASPANCASPISSRFTFSGGPGGGGCGNLSPTLGQVVRARVNLVNGPELKTTGIDFLMQYSRDIGDVSAQAGFTGTYIASYDTDDFFSDGVLIQPGFDAVGKLNFQTSAYPLPNFRGQGWVEGRWKAHDLRFTANFINGYQDTRPPVYRIPSFYTFDFSYNLNLPNDLVFNFTVFNLLDKDPGFARLDLNYDPFTANPLGRQFSFGVRKTF